jgi:hypothetical protein
MAENRGYTQTISTAEFDETPRVNLEQPTGDVYVEAWDKQEIEVAISDPEGFFEVYQDGSNVTIKNNPHRHKVVNFRDPELPELRDLAQNLAQAATGMERKNIERTIERTMRKMGRIGLHVDINLGNWKGGRDYYIKAPHNCHLNLRTSSGDIRIAGITGTILCQTSSGDLRLNEVGGNLLASSASGDITIQSLEGKLGLRTASGDIRTRELSLDELSMHTASGDIQLDLLKLPEKDFEVRTVSGDLSVYAPYDSGFKLETRTISGSVSCGFPRDKVKYQATGRRETSLEVNGGGSLTIEVSTVSGDISINPRKLPARSESNGEEGGAPTTDLNRSSNHGDMTEPEGYAARKQAELEIFQKVERGEMSAQEALDAITRLGR